MSVIGEHFLGYQLTGEEPTRIGNDHPNFSPHGIYPCKGEDSWVAISIESSEEWLNLCNVVCSNRLRNAKELLEGSERGKQRNLIDSEIQIWTLERTRYQAMEELQGGGIRAGAVTKASDILSDPNIEARGYLDRFDHPDAGPSTTPGLPFRFSGMPVIQGIRAPLYSEHTEWILKDLLGISADKARKMTESGTTPLKPIDRVYHS